jgi:hypothetical protein
MEIQYDMTKFFNANPDFIGKGFYFTRDDVTKGDNTLRKGNAWVEVQSGNSLTRKYEKLGKPQSKEEEKPLTRGQIEKLPLRSGELRMYILGMGTEKTYLLYGDATTGSKIDNGENPTTFTLHGNNGKTAKFKTVVVK